MAVSDGDYRIRMAAIGAPGSNNDPDVFSSTQFGKKLLDHPHELPLPSDITLPSTNVRSPCVFVSDDAFRLTKHLLKPFSGRNLTHEEEIFNYRLSRARRIVENCFGILTTRWRVLSHEIEASPKIAAMITTACICLHNWLLSKSSNFYINEVGHTSDEESVVDPLIPLEPPSRPFGRTSDEAKRVRENLKNYFNGVGKVPWQDARVASRNY